MSATQTSPNLGLVLPGTTSPDVTNNANTIALLTAALLQLDNLGGLLTDTGTANAYAVALPIVESPTAGMEINFKAAHANTGASTLALNGGTAKAITKSGTTALAGSEIAANQIVKVIFDGTQWQLISQ
jgi:hypothetical protein